VSTLIWPPRRQDDHDRWYPSDWTEQALCAQVDPEIFFPEKGGSVREPKRVCAVCEVRELCLDYALTHEDAGRFGIWGGTSERERRRLKRAPAAEPSIPQTRKAVA
jgi:WhiB family transcriptional regulator, redox-sensing transcriptional regulator